MEGFTKSTNEIIEQHGFKKINNSMYRKGNITLQNTHVTFGKFIYERIMNYEKAYKVCLLGKYLRIIKYEVELLDVMELDKW